VYCGGAPATREHVPSRVLLDEPYPENLPHVAACRECNSGFSLDEEYLACVVECALRGTTDAGSLRRAKIARILTRQPALAARIRGAISSENVVTTVDIEASRIRRVILKLARGHAMFELATSVNHEPISLTFTPLHVLTTDVRHRFEQAIRADVWPEVGSRKLVTTALRGLPLNNWVIVQDQRYRYLAAVTRRHVVTRIVLSEYLAAEVLWE
jgi:hypothetical protein